VTQNLIAIDWGTTSLRAYRVDAAGAVVASHKSEHGIQSRQGKFEATLGEVLAVLDAPAGAPVLMAGMIGSRQGWVEAPYIETPCGGDGLAEKLTDVPTGLGRKVKIVPACATSPARRPT
jgi:2-dehydro-3-deoxygalactonokinase